MVRALFALLVIAGPTLLFANSSSSGLPGPFGIELRSFVFGAAAGVVGVHLSLLPWRRLPELLDALACSLRTNAALFALASIFAGVLLFY
jgi:hypothetical protein